MTRGIFYSDFTYPGALVYAKKARDPQKGRPLNKRIRLVVCSDESLGIVIYGNDYKWHTFGKLTPDNIFTITATVEQLRNISTTLSRSLHKYFPMFWLRLSANKYKINTRKPTAPVNSRSFVVPGLRIDMANRIVCDPVAELDLPKPNVNPERRKQWLREWRTFSESVMVLDRIGVYATFKAAKADYLTYRGPTTAGAFKDDPHLSELDECLRQGELTGYMLDAIKFLSYFYDASRLLQQIQRVCSEPLRRRRGVIFD